MKRRYILLLALLFAGGGYSSLWALTVSPARTEILLAPGEALKAAISVKNETSAPVRVTMTEKDWFVLPSNKDIQAPQWLSLKGPKEFRLKPGQERKVPLKVRCPKQAQGDLVAMASFAYLGDTPSMIQPMVSVSIYLTVKGTEIRSGEIRELQVLKRGDTLKMGAILKSTGNVHLRPTGQLRLEDEKDRIVAQGPIRTGEPVYPGDERTYATDILTVALAPGHYHAVADLEFREWKATATRVLAVLKTGDIQMEPQR